MVPFSDMSLGELILKCCSVGVPVLHGGYEWPESIGCNTFDSMSVDPHDTNVELCVGKERDDLRLALKRSHL